MTELRLDAHPDFIHDGMVRYHPALRPLLVGIDTVTQHPDNPNNGDVEAIAESIQINGMYRPIYVQRETGHILAGNHTWEACKSLGAEYVPVIGVEGDVITAARVMLGDNKIAAMARPDNGALLSLLEQVADVTDLYGTGYVDRELQALRALSDIALDTSPHGTWPLISFRVHPRVRSAYLTMTEPAVSDADRFLVLLRLAGWEGSTPSAGD